MSGKRIFYVPATFLFLMFSLIVGLFTNTDNQSARSTVNTSKVSQMATGNQRGDSKVTLVTMQNNICYAGPPPRFTPKPRYTPQTRSNRQSIDLPNDPQFWSAVWKAFCNHPFIETLIGLAILVFIGLCNSDDHK